MLSKLRSLARVQAPLQLVRYRHSSAVITSPLSRRTLLVRDSLSKSLSPLHLAPNPYNAPSPHATDSALADASSRPPPCGGLLRWYQCGPTTYDSMHIGHARAYTSFDIVHRLLSKHFGVHVWLAMGVTDVDDKVLARARDGLGDGEEVAQDGEEVAHAAERLARHFELEFMSDLDRLGVRLPAALLRVSEHVDEIVRYVRRLEDAGCAYVIPGDGVYFDTCAFEDAGFRYGKLRADRFQAAADAHEESSVAQHVRQKKRSEADFALWKASKDEGERAWDSPWGRGRPGWHIECSAMSHAMFGGEHAPEVADGRPGGCFELHTGGVDLAFPHHNNEIAQSEAHQWGCDKHAHPHPQEWVNVWMHSGHVNIEGRKMSKSLKNFIRVGDFLDAERDECARADLAFPPADVIRMYCLQTKYNAAVDWSDRKLEHARKFLARLQNFLHEARFYETRAHSRTVPPDGGRRFDDATLKWTAREFELFGDLHRARDAVDAALCLDFDTPRALGYVADLIRATHTYIKEGDANAVLVSHITADVRDFFRTVGFQSALVREESGLAAMVSAGGDEEAPDAEQVVQVAVDFRARIRELAIKASKAAKVVEKRGEQADELRDVSRALFEACDEVRDDGLARVGVKLTDAAEAGRWSWRRSS